MASEVHTYVIDGFESAAKRLRTDIEVLDHEDLDRKWGDSSRRGYDMIYELAVLHGRSAKQLRGEDPGALPWKFGEEWIQAPEDLKSKSAITAYFNETAEQLIAVGREKAEATEEPVSMDIVKAFSFASMHTSYHDAQLNFIQSLKGDLAVHW